jgi:mono/diheme cytochrome c family protein
MSRPVRVILTIIGALLLAIVFAAAAAYFAGGRALARAYVVPDEAFTAPTDSASLAEGRRLAQLYGCTECHAGDLGGQVLVQGGPFGVVAANNLTAGAGGIGARYTDLDFERAIRHGIRPGGQSLVIMPSAEYQHLTDEDVGRIVAYVKQVPAVDRETPPRKAGPIMRAVAVLQADGLLQAVRVDQNARHEASRTPAPTVEYGEYLATACKGCHTADFSGGAPADPNGPPVANITPDSATGIGVWSKEDFERAFRQGRRPDGRELDPVGMPWPAFSVATDEEVEALWLYLRTVAPVEKAVQR